MKQILIRHYRSPCGELILGALDERLCLCDWRHRRMRAAVDARVQRLLKAEYREGDAEVLELAHAQLEEYFRHSRQAFTVPLLLAGTPFQKRVWEALLTIPFGSTSSYRSLAESMGEARAIRAVAAANGANALSILVPCHRIIGSDGALVGYAGGLRAKRHLLALELEGDLFSPSATMSAG